MVKDMLINEKYLQRHTSLCMLELIVDEVDSGTLSPFISWLRYNDINPHKFYFSLMG